jgi:hypothetical protein
MLCHWKELTFGVEIEFSFITRLKATQIVSDFFETSYYRTGDGYDTYEMEDFQNRTWKIMRDSSVRSERKIAGSIVAAEELYQVELVTPILRYDEDIEMLQELVRKLRKGGANVNNSCGMHVHVGAEHFTADKLRILCNLVYSKQNILERCLQVQDGRKRYAKLLSDDFIEKLNKNKPKTIEELANIWYGHNTQQRGYQSFRQNRYHESRYKILNYHPLLSGKQKTVEYRIFNSSMHSGVIKAYVTFCLLLTCQALNQSRASSKQNIPFNDKYFFRVWLLHLGAIGPEFKNTRMHLLKWLTGDSAWKDKNCKDITF